jgi:uncharacterized RmlC-like cupin family protein
MNDNVIKTDYGYEIVWASTEVYCAKILVFEESQKCLPFHFHKSKSKSWFVNSGKFNIQWVDTENGKVNTAELVEGSVFHVPALMPVMLESSVDNSSMSEVSSHSTEKDFFRLN